jgi:uncharacterized protein (TIGR03083 family)
MEIADFVSQLEQDGAHLATAASTLDADVPPCPQWTVRDVVSHLGGIHRWATSIVRDRLDHDPGDPPRPSPGDDLVGWFADGHAALVATLRAADPDVRCWTFLPAPSPLAFWARRQAHETAIHRADAESSSGAITPFPGAFAADGIGELMAFAARRPTFRHVDEPRTLAIRPDSGDGWTVTLAPDGVRAASAAGPADVTVSGSASDLYLWVWNRPASVQVTGDPDVAALWRHIRIR